MPEKYSDTSHADSQSGTMDVPKRIFALDSGSPVSSVALAWDGDLLTREFSVGDSSKLLLPMLDELLGEVGGRLEQLEGLVGLRGPGSFTGLRVGLATLLGLHQAQGIKAGTATTFEALAHQARRGLSAAKGPILAAVDALRGERFVQRFERETLLPLGEPGILSDQKLAESESGCVIGFGLGPLKEAIATVSDGGLSPILDAEPLAPDLAAFVSRRNFVWNALELTEPLYLRPPAVYAKATDS